MLSSMISEATCVDHAAGLRRYVSASSDGTRRAGLKGLRKIFDSSDALIASVVIVEFHWVTAGSGYRPDAHAVMVIDDLVASGSEIAVFDGAAAEIAVAANARFGSGGCHEAKLNLLDIIVYGIAKVTGLPMLRTGNECAANDAAMHPASRIA